MRLYLDDDIASAPLLLVLRQAGHDTQAPADVGLAGRHDAEHLAHCMRERRSCLTRNYRDFEFLHLLVLQGGAITPASSWSAETMTRGATCRPTTSCAPCATWKRPASPSLTSTSSSTPGSEHTAAQDVSSAPTSRHSACASSARGASAMTRTIGSVLLGRT